MSAVEVLRSRPWEAFSFGPYQSLALGQCCSEGQGWGRRVERWPLRRLDGGCLEHRRSRLVPSASGASVSSRPVMPAPFMKGLLHLGPSSLRSTHPGSPDQAMTVGPGNHPVVWGEF